MACDGYDSQAPLMPSATLTRTSAPTLIATATSNHDPMNDFVSLDPATGVDDANEALIEGYLFQLELAITKSERSHGLMNRTNLAENTAMLFVYEREKYLSFWMKNTMIPLDILFLDAKGIVVNVYTMQPQIGVADNVLKVYSSALPARYAMEMNAGLAESMGVMAGVQVLFR